MSSSLAVLVCAIGIASLFYLDRDKSLSTSRALWLPVMWLWIVGSRPVSVWLGMNPATSEATAVVEGSPFDAAVFALLLAVGVVVLINRKRRTGACLKANWPVVVYFLYCLLSVLWSDHSDIAFKRWIKAIGDLVMVLIVVTDAQPVAALRRLFSRVGLILFPISILLIKYFGNLGRGYDPDGRPMNTGVTTNKNTLGVIVFVITLGALWNLLMPSVATAKRSRARHLLAQGLLLALGLALLSMADSATSIACFTLGTVLILATHLPLIRRNPAAVHALVLMILLVGGVTMLFGGQAGVVHALGRETNLTGRTEIWDAVFPVVPNQFVGAGFESFWLPPRLQRVWSNLSQYMHVNEAHNGYIEVYLNLGFVGVGLIAVMLISGYRWAVDAFRRDPAWGSLMLAYVATAAIYSTTEAGYRMLLPIWIFFLLAIVGSHSIPRGTGGGTERLRVRSHRVTEASTSYALAEMLGGNS